MNKCLAIMKIRYIIFSIIILILIVVIACEIDHGLYPTSYKITGEIHFFKGEPPENTDRVEVFALKEFPPQDPQNFLYLGRSGRLDYTQGSSIKYEVQVSKTSYQLIGLLWKEKGEDWNLTGLMGFYTGGLENFFPDSAVVTKENPVAENIDIYASWDRVSKDATISGNIKYSGAWPEDTQLLLLAVYPVKPSSDISYFLFENLDYTQPVFVDSSSYSLKVNSGVYNYVALYWVGKSISNLTDLLGIGYHKNPGNSGEPGKVVISSGQEETNVDILVNFDEIEFPNPPRRKTIQEIKPFEE
ncbi:hypothetical protein ISS22_17085 [candidate division KSB1 bacterium]|nr:hypothetical protein [candidate division KSB1 bacterium]